MVSKTDFNFGCIINFGVVVGGDPAKASSPSGQGSVRRLIHS